MVDGCLYAVDVAGGDAGDEQADTASQDERRVGGSLPTRMTPMQSSSRSQQRRSRSACRSIGVPAGRRSRAAAAEPVAELLVGRWRRQLLALEVAVFDPADEESGRDVVLAVPSAACGEDLVGGAVFEQAIRVS